MSALSAAQRRTVEILTAQGDTPEQIAAAQRLPLGAVRAATKPKGRKPAGDTPPAPSGDQ